MLSVLTIVVLLAATCATAFEGFSEQTLSSAALIDICNRRYKFNVRMMFPWRKIPGVEDEPKSPELEAHLINTNILLRIKTPHSADENSIYFDANAEWLGDDHIIYHRIILKYPNGKSTNIIYDEIISVGLRVVNRERKKVAYIRLDVTFGAPEGNKLALYVPIYKIPQSISNLKKEDREAWAQKAKVGTVSLISEIDFSNILQDELVRIDLVWLEKLLKYGVRDSVITEPQTRIYSTRPIVLSKNKLRNIIQYFDLVKEKARNNMKN